MTVRAPAALLLTLKAAPVWLEEGALAAVDEAGVLPVPLTAAELEPGALLPPAGGVPEAGAELLVPIALACKTR